MTKFIIKSIFFAVLIVCLNFIFLSILWIPRKAQVTLPSNITTLFLGNSTVECGVNDSIFQNSFNFARSAELMAVMYAKLKLIHKYNPQVDTVFLEFDDIILASKEGKSFHSHPYLLDQYNFGNVVNGLIYGGVKHNAIFGDIYEYSKLKNIYDKRNEKLKSLDLGGFRYLKRDKLQEDLIRHQSTDNNSLSTWAEPSLVSQYFLDQIIRYCKKEDITLIFINIPKYREAWNDTVYRKLYREKYSDIKFYDLAQIEYPDSCYGDINHLNYRGAKSFSNFLYQEIHRKNN